MISLWNLGVRSLVVASAVILASACEKKDAQPTPASPGAANSGGGTSGTGATQAAAGSLHDLSAKRIDGTDEKLSTYKGKVVLVVNTASQCGFTPQYEGLEKLYAAKKDKGFVVLGFPSNDFGSQEPDNESTIATFCRSKYSIDFPMFSKVKTKGEGVHPVYAFVSANHGAPKWNFHKYLVGKDGAVVKAFSSSTTPDSQELTAAIDQALAK
jgi:glutathione peroxidase